MSQDVISEMHERAYLISELESFGLRVHRLCEFNDNSELWELLEGLRGFYLKEYALQE